MDFRRGRRDIHAAEHHKRANHKHQDSGDDDKKNFHKHPANCQPRKAL